MVLVLLVIYYKILSYIGFIRGIVSKILGQIISTSTENEQQTHTNVSKDSVEIEGKPNRLFSINFGYNRESGERDGR